MATKKLQVIITGDSRGAQKAMGATGKSADKMAGGFSKFQKVATGAFLVGGAAAVAFAKKSADTFKRVGSETLKLQKFTGQSAQEASRLRYAFQASGLTVDQASKSLAIFSKKVSASKNAQKDFGFEVKDSAGRIKPMNVLLGEAADHFNTLKPGAERTAWVMKTFGKSGMEMTKFLSLGSKGLMELSAQADKYGLTLSGKNLEAVKAAIKGNREQTAAMEGLRVQIGVYVLPLITKLTTWISQEIPKATKFVQDHGDAFKVLGIVVAGVAAGFTAYKVATVVSTVATGAWAAVSGVASAASTVATTALTAEASALTAVSVAATGVGVGLAAVGGTLWVLDRMAKTHTDIAALSTELTLLGQGAGDVSDVTDGMGLDIKDLANSFKIASESPRGFGDGLGYLATHLDSDLGGAKMRKAQNEVKDLDKALSGMVSSGHADEAKKAYGEIGAALLKQGLSFQEVNSLMPKYNNALDHLGRSTKATTAATKADTTANELNTNALAFHAEAVNRDWDALNKLQNLKAGMLNANVAYQQSVADETQALKDNGATIDITTQKGRDNTSAAQASRTAIMQQAQSLRENGATAGQAAQFIKEHTLKLNAQERQAGLSKDQVNFLNSAMGMTPEDINTTFHVDTGAALRSLEGLRSKFREVAASLSETIHTAVSVGTGKVGTNATGTNNWRGGPTWVGERGPEILNLPQGSKIIPNNRARRMAASSGAAGPGAPVYLTVQVEGSVVAERQLVDVVRSGLIDIGRRTGRPVLAGLG